MEVRSVWWGISDEGRGGREVALGRWIVVRSEMDVRRAVSFFLRD